MTEQLDPQAEKRQVMMQMTRAMTRSRTGSGPDKLKAEVELVKLGKRLKELNQIIEKA